MAVAQEFETQAVSPTQLQDARKFAASYAGEHVLNPLSKGRSNR